MKKLIFGLFIVFTGVALFAALNDNGVVAADIASTTDISMAPTYPTNSLTGTPTPVSVGSGCTDIVVVDDIGITDNSVAGWTLTVTQFTGGDVLTHTSNSTTIDYTLEIGGVGGTLGNNLTLSPSAGTILTFIANTAVISPTGTATSATTNYFFDLLMTIDDGAMAGLLAGDYAETLDLLLTSDDL